MPEDKNDWLSPDNPEQEEIRHLVENTDVSPKQAKELVAKHGSDRQKLMEAARKMKAEG